MHMYILHIETSTAVCSVALSNGSELVACQDLRDGMNHSAILAPAIEEILEDASLCPSDLAAISISAGPGSYTGLRVGTSTAKAMAYSLNIPILAVPTLFSLAHAAFTCHRDAEFALPMIDARRNEVYTALYERSGKVIWPVSSVILEPKFFSEHVPVIGQIVTCGDGSLKIEHHPLPGSNLLVDAEIMCSARHLLAPGWNLYQKGIVQDPLHYVPYYMKPPNITVPRQTGFQ